MDYIDAFDIGSIQLEPRLQEYMRCKKFNKENNIEPVIPEEQEFCISSHDMHLIKKYRQGTTGLYSQKRMTTDFVKQDTMKIDKNMFEKDPRYQRLQNKMSSHKNAQLQIRNFDGIDDDYTLYRGSNPYDLNPDKRSKVVSKPFETQQDELYDNQFMMNSRTQVNNNEINNFNNDRGEHCYSTNRKSNNPNTYNHPPSIAYRQVLSYDSENPIGLKNNSNITDVIGKLDKYNSRLSNTYDYVQYSSNDHSSNSRNNREMPSSYQAIPYKFGNGMPDISLEDAMRGGIKDSKRKTTGFKNTFEHNFDYISSEIGDSNHSVQMYPQNTRGNDKEVARPNSSATKSEFNKRQQILNKFGNN